MRPSPASKAQGAVLRALGAGFRVAGAVLRLLAVLASFAAGCLPSAQLVSHLFGGGQAITSLGDGNPGASNIKRAYGLPAAILVGALDMFKAWLPSYLARRFKAGDDLAGPVYLAPVLAHVLVVGGKGAASAVGATAAWDPTALAMVGAGMTWGTIQGYHAPAVAAGIVSFPWVQWLLGRSRKRLLWSLACMSLLVFGRVRGPRKDRKPFSARVLKERLIWDREPRD